MHRRNCTRQAATLFVEREERCDQSEQGCDFETVRELILHEATLMPGASKVSDIVSQRPFHISLLL